MRVFRTLVLVVCGCVALCLSSCSKTTSTDDTNDDDNNNGGGTSVTISQNTVWTSTDIPALVQSITITNGTLTLPRGSVVRMAAGGEISVGVGGGLMADSVKFTGSTAQAGHWRYIWFAANTANTNCQLNNCIIEYGGGYDASSAMVYCDDASPTISHCLIRYSSSYGVHLGTASLPTFVGNTITLNAKAPVQVNVAGMAAIDTGYYAGNLNNSDYIEIGYGAITTNATWRNLGVPYLMAGQNTITNATLTIPAGVTIKMDTDAELYVSSGGGLMADSVTFTGRTAQAGYWRYIWFAGNAANTNCRLTNCTIEYGGGYDATSAMVYCDDASPTVRNCTIRHSFSYGVHLGTASQPTFIGNTITLNAKAPVQVNFAGVASIDTGHYTGNLNSSDYIEVGYGNLTTNAAWRNLGVPYLMANQNTINNATLTIPAGVTVKMDDDAELFVSTGGGLVAVGTSVNQITFTGTTPQSGWWRYLWFASDCAEANCRLSYCTIEYGGGYSAGSAMVYSDAANPTFAIDHCIIRHSSSYGLHYSNAPGSMTTQNTFADNTEGAIDTN
jgi:hypothetical protein